MGYLVKPVSVERIIPSIEAAMRRNADMKKLTYAVQKGKKINRAVGIIMERFKIDQDEAFERMRRMARSHRTKLEVTAGEILNAASLLQLDPVRASAKSEPTRKT
jgi:response regulator NasT